MINGISAKNLASTRLGEYAVSFEIVCTEAIVDEITNRLINISKERVMVCSWDNGYFLTNSKSLRFTRSALAYAKENHIFNSLIFNSSGDILVFLHELQLRQLQAAFKNGNFRCNVCKDTIFLTVEF